MIKPNISAASSLIVAVGLIATATAAPLAALVDEAPVIVAVGILKLSPGVSVSDNSLEFEVRAKVGFVAKGDLKPDDEIKVIIKLVAKDFYLLQQNPFGMKEGGDFIFFLRPRFSSDGKKLVHYRFTEIPLGCLGYDPYSWSRIKKEVEEGNAKPESQTPEKLSD